MNHRDLLAAAELLASAERVVCLTGAGVSAESGVPTFREAQTGLWARFDPEKLASQRGFAEDPGLVWRWYMGRLVKVEQAEPNAGHRALAELADYPAMFTLVTQNVDDLHERAGSGNVLHLHGEIGRFVCNRCRSPHILTQDERSAADPPRCIYCGGQVRPAVVWFGENLPRDVLAQAWDASGACDVMLVVGTSGVVYPAAQLPAIAQQAWARVIDVNPEVSPVSEIADVFLQGESGTLLPRLVQLLAQKMNRQ